MRPRKKANLIVFLLISIIAFSFSMATIALTPNVDPLSFSYNNDSSQLIQVENDNFDPVIIKLVEIKKNEPLNNTTTNNTTNTNRTIIDHNNHTY